MLFLLPKSKAKEDILFYLYITYTNKTSLAVYKLFGIVSIILLYKILIYKNIVAFYAGNFLDHKSLYKSQYQEID